MAALPNFPVVADRFTPGLFTHNTWVDAQNTLCATTDENEGGDVTLYDVSNPANPVRLARISTFGSTAHNVYLKDGVAHVAAYTAGYVCYDVSNPSAPLFLGRYDTNALTGAGYAGVWSVYPFTASGIVYASDIQNGLHVLRRDGRVVDVTHSALGNTGAESDYPVSADLVARDPGNAVASALVRWRVEGGAEQTAPLQHQGGVSWLGAIPGQAAPSAVEYRIEATCANGAIERLPRSGWLRFDVGARRRLYATGFEEANDAGWTHGSYAGGEDWERGDPVGESDDPSEAASGAQCWGTDLGLQGTNGKVLFGSESWLESPAVDCSTAVGTRLRCAKWLAALPFPQEEARITVNGVTVWQNDAFYVNDDAWRVLDLDVAALADGQASVRVRFEFVTLNGLTSGGWNVDDVELYTLRPSSVDALVLTGPAAPPAGSQAQYTVAGGPPGAAWWLIGGAAVGLTERFGAAFDLADPVSLLASGALDAGGAGAATLRIPASGSGRVFYLEAAARPGAGPMADSNLIRLAVP